MSSIRLFVLGALAERGPMHGHQLRLLAEEEHVARWTDITVGGLYGALKRLAAEGLIGELRVEREGGYPQRQVWTITDPGRQALATLRHTGLAEIVLRPDPFDLAVTRLDPDRLDDLPAVVAARIDALRARLEQGEARAVAIAGYLTRVERHAFEHRNHRLRAEITWHEALADDLPAIIADERSRRSS